jgi:hypothetical protein
MTDQTSAEIVLLPCPFCGGTDIDSLVHLDWVACNGCGAALEDVDPSARELWNTRPAASLIEALSAEKAKKRKLIEFVSCLRQHEIDLEVRDELLKLICALAAESTVARLTGEKEIETQKREFAEFEWKRSDERAAAAEARLAEAAQNFRAIKQATVDGRVCDDVAWFDAITTLHDFCELAAINCAVGQRKDGDQRSGADEAAGCNHWPGQKHCGVCGMGGS